MSKLGYALHRGEVFKKNSAAKLSFEDECTVKKFLSVLAGNDYFKDRIVTHFSKLESVLTDPESEFTSRLTINYDLIEVSDGWLFSANKKRICPKRHPRCWKGKPKGVCGV